MKLLKGKHWFELQLDKKGHKGLYVGPLYDSEKERTESPTVITISFMTRRFKLRYSKIKATKKWLFEFAGKWHSEGNSNQYINYTIADFNFD